MSDEACKHIRELLPLHVDAALSGGEAQMVRTHLEACQACRAEVSRWQALDRLVTEGLTTPEPVTHAEVEAAVERVRTAKPTWRVAPAPVRFWRSWVPTASMAAAAMVLAVLILRIPGAMWTRAETTLRQEAAAYAIDAEELGEIVPSEVASLSVTARQLPRSAVDEAGEQWDRGLSLSQDLTRRTGRAPLAACVLLLLAANLLIARGVRAARQPLAGG